MRSQDSTERSWFKVSMFCYTLMKYSCDCRHGDTDGTWGAESCTSTEGQGSSEWWQVDLGASIPFCRVNVWHRTDCCTTRLTGAAVIVSDTPDYSSGTFCELLATTTTPEEVLCRGLQGQFLTVDQRSASVCTSLQSDSWCNYSISLCGLLHVPVLVFSDLLASAKTIAHKLK